MRRSDGARVIHIPSGCIPIIGGGGGSSCCGTHPATVQRLEPLSPRHDVVEVFLQLDSHRWTFFKCERPSASEGVASNGLRGRGTQNYGHCFATKVSSW